MPEASEEKPNRDEFRKLIDQFIDHYPIKKQNGIENHFLPKGFLVAVDPKVVLTMNDEDLTEIFSAYLKKYSETIPPAAFELLKTIPGGGSIFQAFEDFGLTDFDYQLTKEGSRIIRRIAYSIAFTKSRAS